MGVDQLTNPAICQERSVLTHPECEAKSVALVIETR